jgi:hypothetical protein
MRRDNAIVGDCPIEVDGQGKIAQHFGSLWANWNREQQCGRRDAGSQRIGGPQDRRRLVIMIS